MNRKPEVLETIAAVRAYREAADAAMVAFVPTMGALHEGHASLVRRARELAGGEGSVVASIFVNPTQFGKNEDFSRYPRTLEEDLEILRREGCDAVFVPTADEMYGGDADGGVGATFIDPGPMGRILEGAIRPGHFAGVCTVVAKLLNIVEPTHMLMGQKDFQQQLILRKMVRDLNMKTEIVTCDTVREGDGLALSSRNRYLSPELRAKAVVISEALRWGVEAAKKGAVASAIETGIALRIAERGLVPQYVAVAHRESLGAMERIELGRTVLLVAAKAGGTRLIDNMLV